MVNQVGCNFTVEDIKIENLVKKINNNYECSIILNKCGSVFYYACSGRSIPERCPYVMNNMEHNQVKLNEDNGFRVINRSEAYKINVYQIIVNRNIKNVGLKCTCIISSDVSGTMYVLSKANLYNEANILLLLSILLI